MKYEEYEGYLASSERMGSYPDLAHVTDDHDNTNTDIRDDEVHHDHSPPVPLNHTWQHQYNIETSERYSFHYSVFIF